MAEPLPPFEPAPSDRAIMLAILIPLGAAILAVCVLIPWALTWGSS